MLLAWKCETTAFLFNRPGQIAVAEEIIYERQYNAEHFGTDDPQPV